MRKILFTFLFSVICCSSTWALTTSEIVVQTFSKRLSNWCDTKSFRGREEIEEICSGKKTFRASDEFIENLVNRYKEIITESYVLDDYISCLKSAIQDGIRIEVTNIKDRTDEVEFKCKDLVCASCEIRTTGKYNIASRTLFIINTEDNKICRALKYTEGVDRKGKKIIYVDLSDLEDTSMLGFTINHDQHFPIGASIIGQSGWFMCSLDFGINLDSKKYLVEKMDMTNVMNYSSTQTEYDPKMFLTLTPAVFLKYVSVGCGVGFVWLDGKEETSERKTKFDDNGNYSGYTGGSTSTDAAALKFMLRPQVRGYIPLSRSCNMSIGVGYNIVPKMKDLNGYNVSVGFHFDFDEWEDLFSWW